MSPGCHNRRGRGTDLVPDTAAVWPAPPWRWSLWGGAALPGPAAAAALGVLTVPAQVPLRPHGGGRPLPLLPSRLSRAAPCAPDAVGALHRPRSEFLGLAPSFGGPALGADVVSVGHIREMRVCVRVRCQVAYPALAVSNCDLNGKVRRSCEI